LLVCCDCFYDWMSFYVMGFEGIPISRVWFFAAVALLAFFAIFTAIFSTGVLLYPSLYIEQWLLHRPFDKPGLHV